MKQILLATALIALPAGGFAAFELWRAPAVATNQAQQTSLGDLTAMAAIVADVQTIAATKDLVKAETRITDFETAWDDAAATMRPLNASAWGNVDQAADVALNALRAGTPDAATVTDTLAALRAALANPGDGDVVTTGATLVAGVAVTDETGRALPCETMLTAVAEALVATTANAADLATATQFQTKALERCNADDDARADAFSAQALALLLAKQG